VSTDNQHGVRQVLDKMQDMVGALVGKTSAAMGGPMTGPFVKNAMLSGAYEVRAGEIAMRRSSSRPVRAIADKLIADHTMGAQLLFAALGRSDWDDEAFEPTEELDTRREGLINHLEKAPDADFDKRFIDQQAASHDEARTLFESYASSGDDPNLRSYALSILPGIEAHVRAVMAVRAAL